MDDLKAFHISQHMNTDHEYPQEIKYGEGDNEKYLFPIKLVAENTVSMNMIEQNRLIDPFQENSKESRESNKGRDKEFQYLSNGKWYMFISAGPDRLYETDYIKYVINNKSNILMEDAMKLSVTMSYDPTNGAKSRGDYLLIGGSTVQNISAE